MNKYTDILDDLITLTSGTAVEIPCLGDQTPTGSLTRDPFRTSTNLVACAVQANTISRLSCSNHSSPKKARVPSCTPVSIEQCGW